MNESRPPCERCGAPSRVHITGRGADGRRVSHFCLDCADADEARSSRRDRGLNRALIVLAFGAVVAMISLLADQLQFGSQAGFGWKQQVGTVIGGLLVFIAVLMRIPTLLIVGLMAAGLSLLADLLNFGEGEDFGSHQMLGLAVGAFFLICGVVMTRGERA